MQDFGEFAEREQKGWADSAIVSAYVAKFGPVTNHIAQFLISRSTPKGKSVLDLCCGHGTFTAMLSDAGAIVSALDFSNEMLSLAADNAPNAELHQGDAASLPFEEDVFDQVFCNFGMMHLPDQIGALAEVRRVLRPAGEFMMATWATPDVSPAFGIVFGAIKAHADFLLAPAQPDLFAFANPKTASEMMSASGLRVVSHEIERAFWELSEPEELFEIFLTGTVAASQLLKGQKPETIRKIRDQISQSVKDGFHTQKAYRVPVSVAVVKALK